MAGWLGKQTEKDSEIDAMSDGLILHNLLDILETHAPSTLAESWDNVGLMVGDPAHAVSGILVALDPTAAVLDEALASGLNTVITHHPLIFQPLKSVRFDQPTGRILQQAITDKIAVLGCHTNLDKIHGGVNDALAAALGLIDTKPLAPEIAGHIEPLGFGRHGRLPTPRKATDFLEFLAKSLGLTVIAVAGKLPELISTVAVCGGSGSDLAESAMHVGAQVYITGEVKHSTARWAEARDFCVIDAGHYASEKPVVATLTAFLKKTANEKRWGIDVVAATRQKNPFVFYEVQAPR